MLRQDTGQEFIFIMFPVLLHVRLIFLQEIPFFLFLPDNLRHFTDYSQELFCRNRLQHIVRNTDSNRSLGIFKIIITAQDQYLDIGEFLFYCLRKLQPVHKGHLDIRQDHVRLHGLRQFQGVPAVFRLAHQFKSQAAPVHFPTDAHPDVLLVVHQQHLIEAHVFSHPFLRQYSTLPLD